MNKGTRKTIPNLFGIREISEHETVRERLDSGVEIDTTDSGGRTLLMEAVIRGDHELMNYLIRRGAGVNISDNRGWTALHFAAQKSDTKAAKLLLEAGADVNLKEHHGNNVIWRAVFEARAGFDLVELLLSNGANIDEKNESGISAVDLAQRIGDKELVKILDR